MSDLLKENSRVKVIKDGNFVIKKYKSLSDEANKILLAKLEVKDKFSDIEGIVIPTDYTKVNGKVNEIITPYIDKPNFYVSLNHPVYDLKSNSPVTNPYIQWKELKSKAIASVRNDLYNADGWRNFFYNSTFDPRR